VNEGKKWIDAYDRAVVHDMIPQELLYNGKGVLNGQMYMGQRWASKRDFRQSSARGDAFLDRN
jgi:hypothetical protein